MGKAQAKQKETQPSGAVFAFPGTNTRAEAQGEAVEVTHFIMRHPDGRVQEIHANSVEIMEALGWSKAEPKG